MLDEFGHAGQVAGALRLRIAHFIAPQHAPADLSAILKDYDRYLAIVDPVSPGMRPGPEQ